MSFDDRLKDASIDDLFTAMLSLKDHDECYRFFQDLCTVTEIRSLAQRFTVARMLNKGVRYQDIAETTGASTATISRVKRSLEFGADGYRLALERFEAERSDD